MREKYNNGQWTEGRFNSFVKSALRSASRRWPPKYETLAAAYVGKQVNPKTKREGKHYRCASCGGHFPSSTVQVDHIKPVVDPELGFTSWDDVINSMFCEKDNLQVLCKPCHAEKTKLEKEQRSNANQSSGRTSGRKRKVSRNS